jgi:LacI family transcriptional regulator
VATTIRQVAEAAGVSVATASRALSGSTAVVSATRDRVLETARRLDYTPSRLGRSLATGSTGNIGVILPDMTNPFYTSFLAELETALGERDHGILVGDSHEDPERELALVRRMLGQVDALVLASSRLPDTSIVETAARLPVVLANRRLEAPASVPLLLRQVTLDHGPGFRAAAEHLHELGHRHVAYLDGPARSWSGRQKRASLHEACSGLGMTLAIVPTDSPDFSGGRAAVAATPEGCTAIVAFNDQLALGALSGLRDAGVAVPARMSVVGCDDSLPEGLAWPSLTTVESSARALGALTAAAIAGAGAASDSRPEEDAVVPSRLIVRESTAVASVISSGVSSLPTLTTERAFT